MNPTYYYEVVASQDWAKAIWRAERVGTRALVKYWYVGYKHIEPNTVHVFYFRLPPASVRVPTKGDPAPTELILNDLPVDPSPTEAN